ncbi:ExeM/NucH family extracellular endonuclease [Kerstersia sp.]|uniref:ExeM/NucH family extracellular endonuclease n=1 Tax=Kerstersia sp. TaxID=1930783 RepID=UPI003F932548
MLTRFNVLVTHGVYFAGSPNAMEPAIMTRHRRLAPCHAALLTAFMAAPVSADVIFSEYVEGTSNNKALELYNTGSSAVDLAQYEVHVYANGAKTVSSTFKPSGSLAPGATYVIAHSHMADALGSRINLLAGLNYNGDDAVTLSRQGAIVDRIGQVGFRPSEAWVGASGASTKDNTLRRKAAIQTGDDAADTPFDVDQQWDAFPVDSFDGLGAHPGLAIGGTVEARCGAPATAIADLQGRADGASLENVHVEAIVTASYTYTNGFSGFFVQTADAERLRRPGVSEGLFVYAPGKTATAGQRVHLVGKVEEKYNQTQLTLASDVAVCASGLSVQAEPLALPLPEGSDHAQYAGMLVELAPGLTVNNVYELGRYGSILLGNGLLQTPTHAVAPGQAAQALLAANTRNSIILDDGYNHQNPASVPYPAPELSAANTLRRGYTTTTPVRGVVENRYSAWRIQPLPGAAAPGFDPAGNPRPDAPVRASGTDVRVASFNVLNYFNGDGKGGGFPTSRGAKSAAELQRQEDKIVAALKQLDADIIGLMEIENNGYDANSAIHQLTRRMGSNWSYIQPASERLGSDEITVAMMYRNDSVRETGKVATLDIDNKNRMPLAQTFESVRGGLPVTVAVNHFKSKGCDKAAEGDADQNDGQSCWNPTRIKAAQALNNWLAASPTGVETAGRLIIGDLNSYAKEDPIAALANAGYADLLARDGAGAEYSYVFNGMSGYLDHALADPALAAKTLKAQVWHINADEPPALQYSLQYKSAQQQESFYAADPYSSSDHDPVVIDMALSKQDDTGGEESGTPEPGGDDDSSSGGGAMGLGLLAALAWMRRRRAAAIV